MQVVVIKVVSCGDPSHVVFLVRSLPHRQRDLQDDLEVAAEKNCPSQPQRQHRQQNQNVQACPPQEFLACGVGLDK